MQAKPTNHITQKSLTRLSFQRDIDILNQSYDSEVVARAGQLEKDLKNVDYHEVIRPLDEHLGRE